MATGYSVPTSEIDISSADVSASSGSVTAVEGPTKKVKPTPAEWAGDCGSCTLPRERNNFPALAATTSSAAAVNIHGQTQSSSESAISGTTSSSLRQRRAKLATAKIAAARVALAEARLAEIQAEAEIGDEESSDSVGRRNADVLSDFDNDEPNSQGQVENANGQQVSPTEESERTGSASTPKPSTYDVVRQSAGDTTQDDVFSLAVTFPRVSPQRSTSTAEAGSSTQTINDLLLLQRSPTTDVVTFSSTQYVDVDTPTNGVWPGELPGAQPAATKSTYILNHIVNNHEGSNYGHIVQNTQMLQQNIQSAVNTTIHIAEERHLGVINELVDSAEQAHA